MKRLFSVILILISYTSISPMGFAKKTQRSPDKSGPLILAGLVKKLEKLSEDSRSIGLKASLLLTFKNTGTKPIIIYRDNLWLGGVWLSRTMENARAHKSIYDGSAWPSNWGRQSQTKLRKALDQPTPPPNFTLILQPGELWQYESAAYLDIYKKEGPETRGRPWDEIRSLSPVWLFVMFEMWPVNAEPKLDPDNPEFGLTLRKRWENSGELWLDYLTSQPIAIDFNELKKTEADKGQR